MKVEYELDPWEWQGASHSIDIDPEDYEGMNADQIKRAVYDAIREDAEGKLHLVYAEDDVAREVLEALGADSEEDDDDD